MTTEETSEENEETTEEESAEQKEGEEAEGKEDEEHEHDPNIFHELPEDPSAGGAEGAKAEAVTETAEFEEKK